MKKLEEIKKTKEIKIKDEWEGEISGTYYDEGSKDLLIFVFNYRNDIEHLVVSTKDECPNWEQISKIKKVFFNEYEIDFQLRPVKIEYINNEKYCIHIWKFKTQEEDNNQNNKTYTLEDFKELIKERLKKKL